MDPLYPKKLRRVFVNLKHIIRIGFASLGSAVLLGGFSQAAVMGQSTIDPIDLDVLNSRALSQHNIYRDIHRVPAMTTNGDLRRSAQSWAEHLAETGAFEHSGITGVGENLYASYSTNAAIDAETLARGAVQAWYDEVVDYNYNAPGFSGNTGHFTQVVWKASTEVGCGAAQGTTTFDGTEYTALYVVCQYLAPGNRLGDFPANVLEP